MRRLESCKEMNEYEERENLGKARKSCFKGEEFSLLRLFEISIYFALLLTDSAVAQEPKED